MSTPQLRLALISDIQYANINDAHDYGGFELRRYSATLDHARAAVEAWRAFDPPPRGRLTPQRGV